MSLGPVDRSKEADMVAVNDVLCPVINDLARVVLGRCGVHMKSSVKGLERLAASRSALMRKRFVCSEPGSCAIGAWIHYATAIETNEVRNLHFP